MDHVPMCSEGKWDSRILGNEPRHTVKGENYVDLSTNRNKR